MARSVRIELVDGWYHVTARGNERRPIFRDQSDRRRFLELLEGVTEQFAWHVHGYVLMGNHYHLLVQTPRANLSAGMQWLGVSYSVWFNRRHQRVGHLFQGRFHAVVLEEAVALEVSRYVHLNPVRLKRLGLDKLNQRRHAVGLTGPPSAAIINERIHQLRHERWSSYRAYIGLENPPPWLMTSTILSVLGGSAKESARHYRQYVEGAVREGQTESPWERLAAGLLLGSHDFVRRTKARLQGNHREQPALRRLRERSALDDVIRVMERLKRKPWENFRDQHADWGRDAVLWLARRHCGLTLKELGAAVGGIDYVTVSTSVRRLEQRARHDRQLAATLRTADNQLQNAKM
jgi:putative transposase